jgi:hypothetical protein
MIWLSTCIKGVQMQFCDDGRTPEMPKSDWVFWLNVTNIALGVVVILAVLLVVSTVILEVVIKRKKSNDANSPIEGSEDLLPDGRLVPGLGVTMADGGEPIHPLPAKSTQKKND